MATQIAHLVSQQGQSSGGSYTEQYFFDPNFLKYAKLDELALAYVNSTKQRSERYYNTYKSRQLDYLNHYLNRPRKRKYSDQSNIPVSIAQENVDAHHHAIMNRFAQVRKACRVTAPLINPTEKAKKAARLIEAKLAIDNQIMNWWSVYDTIVKTALIMDGCPALHAFKEIVIEQDMPGLEGVKGIEGLNDETTVFQGYEVLPFDPIDYYASPEKSAMNDPYPDIVRLFLQFEDLLEANERGAGYFDLDLIEDKRRSVPDYKLEERAMRQSLLGFTEDTSGIRDGIEVLVMHCRFPIDPKNKEQSEPVYVPCKITVANGQLIGLQRNPNRSKSNMMTMAVVDRVPGQLYGQGIISKIHPQIHAGEAVQDLILENISSTVHRMKGVVEEALVDPSELYSRPDGIIRFKRGIGDIRQLFMDLPATPLGPEIFNLYRMFLEGMEKASFASQVFKGSGQAGVETAQESRDISGFSSMHNDYFMHMLEETFVEPSHRLGYDINLDFVDFPTIFVIGGELSVEWLSLESANQLNYMLQFNGNASMAMRDQTVALQQAMQFLEIGKGHEALEPLLPLITSKIAEAFDWPELEEVKKRLDIGWKQFLQTKKMNMMSMMMQGQQNQGATTPASTKPSQAGVKTPLGGGRPAANGHPQSRPQNMTRAINGSDISKNLASFANMGLPGKVGRR